MRKQRLARTHEERIHFDNDAIELEMNADKEEQGEYQFSEREFEGKKEIVMEPLIRGVISDLIDDVNISSISAKFHNTIARIASDVCINLRESQGHVLQE